MNSHLQPTRAAPPPPATAPATAATAKPIIKNNAKAPNRRGWASMKDDSPIMSWLWTKKWIVLNPRTIDVYKNDVGVEAAYRHATHFLYYLVRSCSTDSYPPQQYHRCRAHRSETILR